MNRRSFIKQGSLWVTGAAAFDIFTPKLRAQQGTLLDPVLMANQSPPPSGSGPSNFTAWYKLNGDATDSSGNGFNGTLVGSPSFTAGQGGFQCLSLNGTSQYLNAGTLTYSPAVTYTAWINVNSYTATGFSYQGIIVKSNGTSNLEFFVKSNGKLACYCSLTSGSIDYDGTGTNTLSTGTWYFVAMTVDSVNGLIGYVNGSMDGSASGTAAINNFSNATWIGSDQQAGLRFFDGLIQDARIYNVALTGSQISALNGAGPA